VSIDAQPRRLERGPGEGPGQLSSLKWVGGCAHTQSCVPAALCSWGRGVYHYWCGGWGGRLLQGWTVLQSHELLAGCEVSPADMFGGGGRGRGDVYAVACRAFLLWARPVPLCCSGRAAIRRGVCALPCALSSCQEECSITTTPATRLQHQLLSWSWATG
jgi:hypothetical protein